MQDSKTVIRHGVFETNSSSTHSICIADKADVLDKLRVDATGTCHIYAGEFGWGPDTFTDAATKASYALTHLKNHKQDADQRLYRERMLCGVVQEATNAKRVELSKVEEDGGYWEYGYIDHQSIETGGGVGEKIWQSPETLKAFIFNPKSVLVIDNDNRFY